MDKNNKKISVIMATHNTPKAFLDDSISSVLEQSYRNFEFIIVCDGVKSEFDYISSTYHDSRIRLLYNDQNMGLPFSLNRAISESSGAYIARMDSDDINMPNRLQEEMNYLNKNGLDICGTVAKLFGDTNKIKRIPFYSPEEIKTQILFRATLIHPTVLGKKSVFAENKYNERFLYSQDFELWSRLSDSYKIGNCNKVLFYYRIHKKQSPIAKQKAQIKYASKIIEGNASKITGSFDKKIFDCLWLLSGKQALHKGDYEKLNQLIDYTIDRNMQFGNYDSSVLKKVLYNRFFELMLKNGVGFAISPPFLRKTIKSYNVRDMAIILKDDIVTRIKTINDRRSL